MRKTTKSLGALLALAMILTVLPAFAAEGRIPVWQPIVIGPGAEGNYIVTRDIIAGPGMPVIDVLPGTVAVDIDLNGFTFYANGAPAIRAAGVDSLTVRNGSVTGGFPANIFVGMPGDPESTVRKVVAEDTKIQFAQGEGVAFYGVANFALRRNIFVSAAGSGMLIDGTVSPVDPPNPTTGTILDNIVRDCGTGITLHNGSSVGIVHNRFENTLGGPGIFVDPGNGFIGCLACLINENTIEETAGDGMTLNHFESSKVYNNTVTFARNNGIYLDQLSQDNLILDNVSSQNFANGMLIDSPQNHIERNVLNTNGLGGGPAFGLWMNGWANTYRGNTAQGNPGPPAACPGFPATTDLCDAPSANNSPGDNFMPGLL